MARVLVTGMSGAGKTTVLDELRRRGHVTVDTDYDGWVRSDGTWDERRMDQLLARQLDVIVSGTVENQGRFYDRFDHVVLLSAPLHVLVERVPRRTNNPYGKTTEQRAEIAQYVETVEPLLRRGATLELDGRRPVSELAEAIERLIPDRQLMDTVADPDEVAFWDTTWERFVARGTTAVALAAWDDEGWPAGRRYLTVLAEVPSLEPLAVQVGQAAGCPPIRADGLHLTIQELGFADELSPNLIARVQEALEQLTGPVDLVVTGVCSFPDAIVATLTPFEPVRRLRRHLRQAVPELADVPGDPDVPAADGGMAPHVSLSYYDSELPTSALADKLWPFRTVEPLRLQIRELSLVAVHPPDGLYFTWYRIARFPLTAKGPDRTTAT